MDRPDAAWWEEKMGVATSVAAGELRRNPRKREAVAELQRLLNRLGAGIGVDGIFGRDTEDAVMDFQDAHGLDADGIVGPLTAQALELALAHPGQTIKAEARTNLAGGPVWWQWALHEIGVAEVPGRGSDDRILEYRNIAKCPSNADDSELPWCAIFVNAALEVNGLPGTRVAGARSFERHANFVRLDAPALGCIVTFWRVSPHDGRGHVGLYRGETDSRVYSLGGNQGDAVSIAPFVKSGNGFGFSGYWWPKTVPLPMQLAAIPIRAGEPLAQVTVV
jgi:uncharacterized protein (TIGR02594 family)